MFIYTIVIFFRCWCSCVRALSVNIFSLFVYFCARLFVCVSLRGREYDGEGLRERRDDYLLIFNVMPAT